jgi:pimeloyl-ACP methyl ester carboxylesterase
MELSANGARLHYEAIGSGEPVVLLGEAGFGPWQWSWQHDALAGLYQVFTVEMRGHGDSTGTPNSVATLASDLDAVLADGGVDRAHLVGVGLGGATALRYANEFGRARTLTLIGTTPNGNTIHCDNFAAAIESPDTLETLFTPMFHKARPDITERIVGWRREEHPNVAVRTAALNLFETFDASPLYKQTTPTLVLHGIDDPLVPIAAGKAMGADLPNGRFEAIKGRHFAHAECSTAVNDEILGFLSEHPLNR